LEGISGGISKIGEAFGNTLDPSAFDTTIFTSVFAAGLTSMLIALEMFKEELGKISIDIDTSTINKNLTDIQTKINGITASNINVSFNTTTIEEAGSSFDRILSIIGSVIALLGIGATVWEHFAGKASANGMETAMKKCRVSIDNLIQKMDDIFDDNKIAEKAKILGENIADGLIEGLKNKLHTISQVTYDMAGTVISETESGFQISSPSKVFKRIGAYISEGLGEGISEGAKAARSAMEGLSDNVVDASKSLSKIEDGAKDYSKSLKRVGEATDDVNNKKISFGGAFAIAVGIIGTLVEFFKNLMETNEEFGAKVDEVWGAITEAFQPVIDAVMGFFEGFVTGSETTGGAMEIISEIIAGASEFICGIIQWISDFWAQHGEAIMAGIQAIWDFLQPIIEGIKTFVGGLFEFIMGIFTGDTEAISNGLGALWEGIKNIFAPVIEFFGNIFAKVWEAITAAFSAVGEFFANVWNSIAGAFSQVLSFFSGVFKSAWEAIKGIFSGIGEFFGGIWDKIVGVFRSIGTKIGDAVSGAFRGVVNGVLGFVEKRKSILVNFVEKKFIKIEKNFDQTPKTFPIRMKGEKPFLCMETVA